MITHGHERSLRQNAGINQQTAKNNVLATETNKQAKQRTPDEIGRHRNHDLVLQIQLRRKKKKKNLAPDQS